MAPVGAPAFPGSAPLGRGGRTPRVHSSVMISSDVRRDALAQPYPPRQGDRARRRGRRSGWTPAAPRSSARLAATAVGVDGAPHRRADAHVGVAASAAHQLDHVRRPTASSTVARAQAARCHDGDLVVGALVVDRAGGTSGRTRRCEMRAVPTASKGFMAATSRKPGAATTRPRRGTCSSASLITVMSTLSVSSGMRLISSTYSSEPSWRADDQRTVDEHVGDVAVGQHASRVEVADQPGGRELGVALDELEADAQLVGHGAQQRRLAGARRALQQDVPAGGQRRDHQLQLPPPAHDVVGQAGRGGCARSSGALNRT